MEKCSSIFYGLSDFSISRIMVTSLNNIMMRDSVKNGSIKFRFSMVEMVKVFVKNSCISTCHDIYDIVYGEFDGEVFM